VVLARREIGALSRVVQQLPVKMLQQCSSASSCMRMRMVMEEHYVYTACQHITPFFLNDRTQFFIVSQYSYLVIVVPCCVSSTISTPFLSQNIVAISFMAGRQCLFKLFRLIR
jgi:hypothetical protein